MAETLVRGVEKSMNVVATVTRLNFAPYVGVKYLIIEESTVDLYVVTADVADGGALPSSGRIPVPTSQLPKWIDIEQYGQVGLAGTGAGSARVEAR